MTDASPLLTPVAFGAIKADNRVLMAPLTRNRAGEDRAPHELNVEYYRQRAGFGLIFTEATVVSRQAIGYLATPGLYSDDQVESWSAVTDAVHQAGGTIVAQLWHVGRVSHTEFHDGAPPVGPTSANAGAKTFTSKGFEDTSDPRPLATAEVAEVVADFAQATRNAMRAGFDGVEVHAANGYLLEQFLASDVNDRDDRYGGSIANRARLTLEVVDAVVGEWDAGHVGIRLSLGNGTAGATDEDPLSMLRHLGGELGRRGLAYVSIVEGMADHAQIGALREGGWDGAAILNGGYDLERGARTVADGTADAIAYGRLAIANPDLPARFAQDAELNTPEESTFYGGDAQGYTDYAFLDEA